MNAVEFLTQWYDGCGGYAEITLLDDRYKDDDEKRRHPLTAWLPITDLSEKLPKAITAAQARNADGYGVYFGVTSRREKQPQGRRGGKDNAHQLPGLWADLDVGQTNIEKATVELATWVIPPTVIVATGGGVQAWWQFTEPLPVQTEDQRQFWERVLRGLARVLNADSAVADVARVMRCPDTHNMKPDRGAYLARVVSLEAGDDIGGCGARYNPFRFAVYEKLAEPPKPRTWKRSYTPRENGQRSVLTMRAREFIASGAPKGTRHISLIHTAYQCREKGYGKDEAYELAGNAALRAGLPEREIENVIEYVYSK